MAIKAKITECKKAFDALEQAYDKSQKSSKNFMIVARIQHERLKNWSNEELWLVETVIKPLDGLVKAFDKGMFRVVAIPDEKLVLIILARAMISGEKPWTERMFSAKNLHIPPPIYQGERTALGEIVDEMKFFIYLFITALYHDRADREAR